MMNPQRRESRVERSVRTLRPYRDLILAVIFLLIGFLMGKF